jgi:hypothetical protein
MRPPVPARPVPDAAGATRQRIRDDHRGLAELLAELESTRDLARVRIQLAELGVALRRHFEVEEAPEGLHAVVGEQAGHQLASLQRLFAEHREIVVEVEQLRVAVGDCLDGPVRRVLAGVAALAERLRRHEADEERLLAEAFWSDLGGRSG